MFLGWGYRIAVCYIYKPKRQAIFILPASHPSSLHIPIVLVVRLWRRRQVRVNVLGGLGRDLLLLPRLFLVVVVILPPSGPLCLQVRPVARAAPARETGPPRCGLQPRRRHGGLVGPVHGVLLLLLLVQPRVRKVARAAASRPDVV